MIEKDCEILIREIKNKFNVNIASRNRSHKITRFKGIAYTVLREHSNYTFREIAEFFKIDRTTIVHHVKRHYVLINQREYANVFYGLVYTTGKPPILDAEEIKNKLKCILETE